jgi:hypothetical protein
MNLLDPEHWNRHIQNSPCYKKKRQKRKKRQVFIFLGSQILNGNSFLLLSHLTHNIHMTNAMQLPKFIIIRYQQNAQFRVVKLRADTF